MAVKVVDAKKTKFGTEPLLSFLITFGPYLMWWGLHHGNLVDSAGRLIWPDYAYALVGTVMLSYGLYLIKIRQDRIEKRLGELERLKN